MEYQHQVLSHGMDIICDGRKYVAGSVAGYAIEYNECPEKALTTAKARGEECHWLAALGATITSHKQPEYIATPVEIGQRVIFEGCVFEIRKAPNHNLKLERVA